MKKIKLNELIKCVKGEIKVLGNDINLDIEIAGVNSLKYASENEISFFSSRKYWSEYLSTQAKVICVNKSIFNEDLLKSRKIFLLVDDIKRAMKTIIGIFYESKNIVQEKKIHPTAVISSNAIISERVIVEEYTVIRDNVKILDGTKISSLCYIGENVCIGKNCIIYPSVKIMDNCIIGDNVIIHSGTVIGADGFGYCSEKRDGENVHYKIYQIGIVEISSNVEIGANVTIDRATLGKTFIGEGTKIDNLVHIAHNVEIGKNCLIIAQVGIAGSCKIGDNVILAGQAGISDHIVIKDNAIVAAQAGVISDVESGIVVSGYPAREHSEQMKALAFLHRMVKEQGSKKK